MLNFVPSFSMFFTVYINSYVFEGVLNDSIFSKAVLFG